MSFCLRFVLAPKLSIYVIGVPINHAFTFALNNYALTIALTIVLIDVHDDSESSVLLFNSSTAYSIDFKLCHAQIFEHFNIITWH